MELWTRKNQSATHYRGVGGSQGGCPGSSQGVDRRRGKGGRNQLEGCVVGGRRGGDPKSRSGLRDIFHKVPQFLNGCQERGSRAGHMLQSRGRIPFALGIKTTKYVAAVGGGGVGWVGGGGSFSHEEREGARAMIHKAAEEKDKTKKPAAANFSSVFISLFLSSFLFSLPSTPPPVP